MGRSNVADIIRGRDTPGVLCGKKTLSRSSTRDRSVPGAVAAVEKNGPAMKVDASQQERIVKLIAGLLEEAVPRGARRSRGRS
jgi:hypothetical protein